MPYNSGSGAYERRTTTVIDATPDGDTVAVAIDVKLDTAADDAVLDLNHHKTNGNHHPATSTHTDSRFLKQSPLGVVSWADGVVAADAALKDFSNVASGAITPAKVAQDASNRFMTDTERTKLSGISTGAQVNSTITKAEIESKLTGTLTSHAHAYVPTGVASGAVESLCLASNTSTSNISFGGTIDGSALKPIGISPNIDTGNNAIFNALGSALTGTWLCLGYAPNTSTPKYLTLWKRTA